MPLTTAQAFDLFVVKISPTDDQRADITNKRNATEKYLGGVPQSNALPLKRVILSARPTGARSSGPVNDVDVLAEFTDKDRIFDRQYRQDSGAFLQRIRTALNAKTTIKKIGAHGQAVRLFYVNGAHVDIAPVFKWDNTAGFGLPKGDGGEIIDGPRDTGDVVLAAEDDDRLELRADVQARPAVERGPSPSIRVVSSRGHGRIDVLVAAGQSSRRPVQVLRVGAEVDRVLRPGRSLGPARRVPGAGRDHGDQVPLCGGPRPVEQGDRHRRKG